MFSYTPLVSTRSCSFLVISQPHFASNTVDQEFKVGSETPGDAEKHIEKFIGIDVVVLIRFFFNSFPYY